MSHLGGKLLWAKLYGVFSGPDTADVESLKVEIEKLKEQLADMTSRAETAEASVAELQGKLDASEADQSEPKEEPKPE